LISICSDLPPDVEADLAPLANVPVLVVYGLRDPVIPQEKPLHAADALRQGGISVELVSFDRGHVIPSSLAPKARDWMERALSASRPRSGAAAAHP
jgi:predicted esterase